MPQSTNAGVKNLKKSNNNNNKDEMRLRWESDPLEIVQEIKIWLYDQIV